jgi:hypothetical protein
MAALFHTLLVLVVLAAAPRPALAAAGIFTPLTEAAAKAATADAPAAKDIPARRSRLVSVDIPALFPAAADSSRQALPKASLTLNLFDDVTIAMTPTAAEAVPTTGSTVLVGENEAAVGGQSRFARTGGAVYGLVRPSGNLLYEIAPQGGQGAYVIREIDQADYPDEHEVLVPEASLPKAGSRAATAADDGSVIDVMILYTPSARAAAGGTEAMASRIALALSETNQGYANSGLVQRFRLVQAREVAYTETGFSTALSDLRGTADGNMDDIHALRNTYGADIVSLFINDSSSCGLGYLMTSTGYDFSGYAFNVVHYTCATGYYSFAHESGHNQGAHHDRANASGSVLYTYAYGYQQTAAPSPFRTIMAYACSGLSCTRVNYWSNPEVNYTGYPTGVLHTAANAADNRRTLDNTRTIAANWRQSVSRIVPSVPLGLLLLE